MILAALIACFAVGAAAAQSCDSKAVSANGKPLHGAAKMSFVKKCSGKLTEAKQWAPTASRFTVRPRTASWRSA
jgi:hypothetical protein